MLKKKYLWFEILLFFLVGAVLYLLFAKEFGYYNDDWYSMYAARVAGADIFHEIYSIDRPGRAYVMIPLYLLFKGQPFLYNLSAYFFRVAGALAFLWLLRLLWADHKTKTLLAALLFLIYPGFLDMPIAIDFQSHLIGVFMAFVSLGLMVKSFALAGWKRALAWLASVLLGWAYLSQMEYYIGFEGVRLALIVLLVLREKSLRQSLKTTVLRWLPFTPVAGGFLVWRLFIFESDRAVTNTSAQLSGLFTDTLLTLYTWAINFVESLFNVLLLAWTEPLNRLGFALGLKPALHGMLLAFVMAGIFGVLFYFLLKKDTEGDVAGNWQNESLGLGIAWLVVGLIPVIVANRSVSLAEYGRYGFVSAPGAMLVLLAFITQLRQKYTQMLVLMFLIFSATFSHYGNGLAYAHSFETIREFWWQVSWRVPQFEPRTTIIASYPGGVRETSFVWGPANQIYYPELLEGKGVQTGIYALMLNDQTISRVLAKEKTKLDRYNVVQTYPNPRNLLILSKPTPNSCVQVIGGAKPIYSPNENGGVRLLGSYSETNRILADAEAHTPPFFLFGAEPAHDWCYFYARADLARQRGDWVGINTLFTEASQQEFVPHDPIEWMPFVQASAMLGDADQFREIESQIKNDFVRQQACEILSEMNISPEMYALTQSNYCASE